MLRRTAIAASLALLASLLGPGTAHALIRGDVGNTPIPDPGWAKGGAALMNTTHRIAWWEGPPFGGGNWHAECRGDAKALSEALAGLARIEGGPRRVRLHDGVGYSFWVAPNREPAKLEAARIDWIFSTWQPSSWEHARGRSPDLNPTDPADTGPPSEIDVFTGGAIRWEDVVVPPGLAVDDRRLVAHGFTAADGVVVEGKVTDLATGRPLVARVRLHRGTPPELPPTLADASGRWVFKNVPAGSYGVVVEDEGYAPRTVGYVSEPTGPCWKGFDAALARVASVSGRVDDEAGRPLDGVVVQLLNVADSTGRRYEGTPLTAKTDAAGRFRLDGVPTGSASAWVAKPGYLRPGLGAAIQLPTADLALRMIRSATVVAAVDFGGKPRPSGYFVRIVPEGGEVVGSYGGGGEIDDKGRFAFTDVPPGRYVISGRPNPSTDTDPVPKPITVDLKGGDDVTITLEVPR